MNENTPTVRLLLSAAASEVLSATGAECFTVICRATRNDPDEAGRFVVHLAPVSMPTAKAACHVLLGTHRAVRIPQPKPVIQPPMSPAPAHAREANHHPTRENNG